MTPNGRQPNNPQINPQPAPVALAHVETSQHAMALVPTTIDGAMQLARWLSSSKLLPPAFQGKEHDVFMVVMAGMELGLPPMAALRGLYAVNGRTALEAKTKAAICLQRGAAEYFKKTEDTPEAVTWETRRKGDTEVRLSRYTKAEAQAAGLLNKDGPWKQYTRRMMSWRALGFLCDDTYPDVVLGVATAEDFEPEELAFRPIATVSPGVDVGKVIPAAKPAIAEQPAASSPAPATKPEAPPMVEQAKPLSEDDVIEIITAFGKCQTIAELKKISSERVATANMDQGTRERLAKAFEDQWYLIKAAEREDGGGQ